MNLLIEGLKKTRQESPVLEAIEIGMEELVNQDASEPVEHVRINAQNLFAAKSPPPPRTLPRRLIMIGGMMLLIASGAGWYLATAGSNALLHVSPQIQPASEPAAAQPAPVQTPVSVQAPVLAPENKEVKVSVYRTPAHVSDLPLETPQESIGASNMRIQIEQRRVALPDASLNDAYLAYRNGKLDEAQQLYLDMLKKEDRNIDALLGLAVIYQQRGDNLSSVQYYARVLALDPRNGTANAGMFSINADDHSESRLKTLLREQGNSATLHFALGNLYAEQSRWSDAQQVYFNAYMLEPGSAEYAYNLAVSQDHLGQKKLAAQYYRRAIELDPSQSAGFEHAQILQRAQELTR